MIKAVLLIFKPVKVWDQIFQAQRGVGAVLLIFLLPVLVITGAAEGYGLVKWGEPQTGVKLHLKYFMVGEAIAFEVTQLVLSLLIVSVAAGMVKSLGGTFHGRHTFKQTFTLVAYGLSPLFLLRILDAAPISPWIAWAIGFSLSAGALYQGVPKIMQPDPPQAFGLYLISILLLAVATGLVRFVTAWYLQGKFPVASSVFDLSSSLFTS